MGYGSGLKAKVELDTTMTTVAIVIVVPVKVAPRASVIAIGVLRWIITVVVVPYGWRITVVATPITVTSMAGHGGRSAGHSKDSQ